MGCPLGMIKIYRYIFCTSTREIFLYQSPIRKLLHKNSGRQDVPYLIRRYSYTISRKVRPPAGYGLRILERVWTVSKEYSSTFRLLQSFKYSKNRKSRKAFIHRLCVIFLKQG